MNVEEHSFLQPVQNTNWLKADQAGYMKTDDLIFGLSFKGQAWAMPWWIIKNHHVANLTLDDQPVMMSFCEICSGSAAFVPLLNGRRHTFRVKGLYNGTHFLIDDETGSFWTPFAGSAVYGPLKGTRLERLPLHTCTWEEWMALYPQTLVADSTNEPRGGHGRFFKPGKAERAGAEFMKNFKKSLSRPLDPRLPENTLVVGVEINGRFRAYPLEALDKLGAAVNDTLNGAEILIMHKPGSLLTAVFSRRLGNTSLVFENAANNQIVDRKYRSTWNYDGAAYTGELAGQKLSYVPWVIEEWYSWSVTHPQTEIFNAENTLSGSQN
jgi:hypothetical protein